MKNEMNLEKRLKQLEYDRAFPETPEAFGDAIHMAGTDIRRHELRAAMWRRRGMAVAAVLVLAVGLGAAIHRLGQARRDEVLPPPVLVERPADVSDETMPEHVYASNSDPCYHLKPDCPDAQGNIVEIPLETAIEVFDKTPCPACRAQ